MEIFSSTVCDRKCDNECSAMSHVLNSPCNDWISVRGTGTCYGDVLLYIDLPQSAEISRKDDNEGHLSSPPKETDYIYIGLRYFACVSTLRKFTESKLAESPDDANLSREEVILSSCIGQSWLGVGIYDDAGFALLNESLHYVRAVGVQRVQIPKFWGCF